MCINFSSSAPVIYFRNLLLKTKSSLQVRSDFFGVKGWAPLINKPLSYAKSISILNYNNANSASNLAAVDLRHHYFWKMLCNYSQVRAHRPGGDWCSLLVKKMYVQCQEVSEFFQFLLAMSTQDSKHEWRTRNSWFVACKYDCVKVALWPMPTMPEGKRIQPIWMRDIFILVNYKSERVEKSSYFLLDSTQDMGYWRHNGVGSINFMQRQTIGGSYDIALS